VPRIIVTPDDADAVVYEEQIPLVLLQSEFAVGQLLERILWAVGDAGDSEPATSR
jgi:hypothetical protein